MHVIALTAYVSIRFKRKGEKTVVEISIKGDYRSDYPSQIGDKWTIDNQYGVLCGLWMYKRLYERLLKEFSTSLWVL